jgi:hypothetical protein
VEVGKLTVESLSVAQASLARFLFFSFFKDRSMRRGEREEERNCELACRWLGGLNRSGGGQRGWRRFAAEQKRAVLEDLCQGAGRKNLERVKKSVAMETVKASRFRRGWQKGQRVLLTVSETLSHAN